MKRTPATLLLVTGLVLLASALDAKPPKPPDFTSLSAEDLIAQFQVVSKEGVGEDAVISSRGILGKDRFMGKPPMGFGFGSFGVPIPMVSPVMRELIRRGVAVVPALLEHLTDARPTPLVVPKNNRGNAIYGFGDEYDPRDPEVKKLPAGLNRINEGGPRASDVGDDFAKHFSKYRVKVGDLCWVALGQIVNRRLEAVHGRPTGIVQVNSPVHTPALAAAARADWGGLTPAEFKGFLVRDLARVEDNWTSEEVLQRLYFYYPQEAIAEATGFLKQPLYNLHPVKEFLNDLYSENDEKKWDQKLTDFRAKYGESSYQAAAQEVVNDAGTPPFPPAVMESDPEIVKYRKNAIRLARSHFARVERHPRFAQWRYSSGDRSGVVESVANFQSAEIDAAVRDLLKRTLDLRPDDPDDRIAQCHLAAACAERFVSGPSPPGDCNDQQSAEREQTPGLRRVPASTRQRSGIAAGCGATVTLSLARQTRRRHSGLPSAEMIPRP